MTMELIEFMNNRILFPENKINVLTDIDSNKKLEALIASLRLVLDNQAFEAKEEIDSYFKTAILLFTYLDTKYWEGNKKTTKLFAKSPNTKEFIDAEYFRQKMGIIITNKEDVIKQLFLLWENKKVDSVEYSFRGVEVLLNKSRYDILDDFPKDIIQLIVSILSPLINRANKVLNTQHQLL